MMSNFDAGSISFRAPQGAGPGIAAADIPVDRRGQADFSRRLDARALELSEVGNTRPTDSVKQTGHLDFQVETFRQLPTSISP